MLKLEKLYDCARDHLENGHRDWDGFATQFKEHMGSEFVLYLVKNDDSGWVKDSFINISGSNPSAINGMLEDGLHRNISVREVDLNDLEPIRRTDLVPDEEFVHMVIANEFYLKYGLFYLMIVPALLADNRSFNLVVWRDKNGTDFDNVEKMRLSLFMRYLIKIIDPQSFVSHEQSDELSLFGKTYGLTEAETEILSYLLEGYSLRKIAAETDRTYGTVRWHIRNLLEKCHVPDQKNLLREFYSLIKR